MSDDNTTPGPCAREGCTCEPSDRRRREATVRDVIPFGYVWECVRDDRLTEIEAAPEHVAWLVGEVRRLRAELVDAERRATFACENPCGDCAGCGAADDYHAAKETPDAR